MYCDKNILFDHQGNLRFKINQDNEEEFNYSNSEFDEFGDYNKNKKGLNYDND